MRNTMLFPGYFKWIGLLLFVLTFFIDNGSSNLDDLNDPMNLVVQLMSFLGLLFIAGSRLKDNDERIEHIRLNSIKWALLIYMGIRIGMKLIAFITKDPQWLPVNFHINMLLIIFILIFYSRTRLIDIIGSKWNNKSDQ